MFRTRVSDIEQLIQIFFPCVGSEVSFLMFVTPGNMKRCKWLSIMKLLCRTGGDNLNFSIFFAHFTLQTEIFTLNGRQIKTNDEKIAKKKSIS